MVDRKWFSECAAKYADAAVGSDFPIDWNQIHPCDDRNGGAAIDLHYTPMDLWAATAVDYHCNYGVSNEVCTCGVIVDVGSRVDGLCAHLLSGGHGVMHVDIRDPGFTWQEFEWRQDDARTLETFSDSSVRTLSCCHSAEHCGLGRYGDEIDPDGMLKCMQSLARVLAPGGRLYFACPIGRQRVVFNAHRVASPSWVAEKFMAMGLQLQSFAAVDDAGKFHSPAFPTDYEQSDYACGMFEWSKQ